MRIIAGRFKGVRLPVARTGGVRPTTDRVREALFSVLGTAVEGSRVLELFAGTGAFGLEALSRGAEFAAFVDRDRRIVEMLRSTVSVLGLDDRVQILGMSASAAMAKLAAAKEVFHIVYLDPPYATNGVARVISDPVFPLLLEAEGLLVVERDVHATEPGVPPQWSKTFSRKYGGTMVEIFRQDIVP
jgi:16S rRNA (guanine966-N2)-methyltransferase